MKDNSLPDSGSWNQFWKKGSSLPFDERSWAKRRVGRVLLSSKFPDGEALDAGCGSGYFSLFFLNQGRSVVSLDYSSEALAMTKQRTDGKVFSIQADLLRDDLSAGQIGQKKIGLVFSDGLFEHFEPSDQDKMIANLKGVMADDSRIVTFVPNRFSPWQLIRPLFMPGIHEKPFTLPLLVDLHERNGFQVLKSGGVNVLPIRYSPEFLGPMFGMLLYVIAKK